MNEKQVECKLQQNVRKLLHEIDFWGSPDKLTRLSKIDFEIHIFTKSKLNDYKDRIMRESMGLV